MKKYANARLLYRYRKVTNYSIEELINDELVLSSADTFNDSHDMTIGYNLETVSEFLLKSDSFIRAMFNDTKRTKSFDDRYNYLKSKKGKHVVMEFANILCVDAIKRLKTKFLVGCFTHKDTNQVMWSHYADYGKGFLVGYKQNEIVRAIKNDNKWNVKELFNKVKYSYKVFDASKMLADSIIESCSDDHIGNYYKVFIDSFISLDKAYDNLFIKNPVWQHEKEIRLLMFDKSQEKNSHRIVAKIKPSVVIMGEDISLSNKYLLVSICKNKNIPIMIAESCYKNNKYELCVRPLLSIEIENLLKKFKDILKLDGLTQ